MNTMSRRREEEDPGEVAAEISEAEGCSARRNEGFAIDTTAMPRQTMCNLLLSAS